MDGPDEVVHGPLAEATARIGASRDGPPGVCVAVGSPAGAPWSARGVAQAFDDRGRTPARIPMGLGTRTDLGSVTKIVATTTSILRLVDDGTLTLHVPCERILPVLKGSAVGSATLAQLLGHQAGLWEWWPLYLQAHAPHGALRALVALPLRYKPGQGRHYSDLGFMILGAVVAAATDTDLGRAFSALVAEPMALVTTRYAAPVCGDAIAASSNGDRIEENMVRTGRPYPVGADAGKFDRWRRHVLVGEVNDGNAFHAFCGTAGHAGLFSSAADLLRFGAGFLAWLDGDGPVRATTARTFCAPGPDPSQALGWRTWTSVCGTCTTRVVGHTGFPGIGLALLVDHRATIALVTNRLHVAGQPRSTDAMLADVLDAAHRHLHQ